MDHNGLVYEARIHWQRHLIQQIAFIHYSIGTTVVTISMWTRQYRYSFWHGVGRFNQKFREPELSDTGSTILCSRNLKREILDCFAIILENGWIRFFSLGPAFFNRPAILGMESLSNSYPNWNLSETYSAVFAENWVESSVSLSGDTIHYNRTYRHSPYSKVATNGQPTWDEDHLKFPGIPKHEGYQ